MQQKSETFSDRLFRKRDRQTTFNVGEFVKALNIIVGLDQLLDNFSAKLVEVLGTSSLHISLFEPITNRYVGKLTRGQAEQSMGEFSLTQSDNLIRWLTVNRCALNVPKQSQILDFLAPHERELVEKSGTVLVVPLITTNRLTGILFIGAKVDAQPYRDSEIEFVSRISDQAALAIEHALVHQFQQDRLKKLLQADRLATVGELAAGAAHEIRNPLTSIRSTIQFLQKDLPEEKRPLAAGVIDEVDRIDKIIKGLLSLSRSTELHVGTVDVRELMEQTLLLLEPELRKQHVDVVKNFDVHKGTIRGDSSQLKQVFLNILLNGIEALPMGGTITVSLTDEVAQESARRQKDYTFVEISDSGQGITESDLQKVFDPFFTTKEAGTGLGLSIAYGIVSKHGGEIQIESRTVEPRGTKVMLRLPQQSQPL